MVTVTAQPPEPKPWPEPPARETDFDDWASWLVSFLRQFIREWAKFAETWIANSDEDWDAGEAPDHLAVEAPALLETAAWAVIRFKEPCGFSPPSAAAQFATSLREMRDAIQNGEYLQVYPDSLREHLYTLENAVDEGEARIAASVQHRKRNIQTSSEQDTEPTNTHLPCERGGEPRGKAAQRHLKIDAEAKLAFWDGKHLDINSNADFTVLDKLLAAKGAIVSYIDLLRAIKPAEVGESVKVLTEAPPEAREAASHIRQAMKAVGCPHKLTSVQRTGYRLRLPDK